MIQKYYNFWHNIVPINKKPLIYFLIIFNLLLLSANMILALGIPPYGIFIGMSLIIFSAFPLGIAYCQLEKVLKDEDK